jgi:hypothetical protein
MSEAGAPPTIPPLAERLLHDFAQKALTTVAVGLASHGALSKPQEPQFVEIGVALVLYLIGCFWTVAAAWWRQRREHTLQNAAPPAP